MSQFDYVSPDQYAQDELESEYRASAIRKASS